jgi:methylated-DNA-[protein]-cysteine S-methyltransferase
MSTTIAAEDRAASRLVRRAFERLTGRGGELLHYALMDDTPVGLLGLAAGPAGLRRLDFIEDEDEFVALLLRLFPDQPVERSAALDPVRREMESYFKGKHFVFEAPVDLSAATPFQQQILRELRKVPAGKVTTYSRLAARVGRPKAARAAGNAMHSNPVAIIVPCHRVLRGDGSLGGYGGGLPAKEWLLKLEGAIL